MCYRFSFNSVFKLHYIVLLFLFMFLKNKEVSKPDGL